MYKELFCQTKVSLYQEIFIICQKKRFLCLKRRFKIKNDVINNLIRPQNKSINTIYKLLIFRARANMNPAPSRYSTIKGVRFNELIKKEGAG